ncbi:MAG: glycosyltransferase [Flavobacteriales bacterium]|nr:glycosyltransferase [Flavobacteriales bacterium]
MRFPFGNGEAFLENELPVLAKGFKRIKLFPLSAAGPQRSTPPNVDVVRLFKSEEIYRPSDVLSTMKELPILLKLLRNSRRSAPSAAIFAKHRREIISRLRQALYREKRLRAYSAKNFGIKTVTLYSYWTADWSTVLGLLKAHEPEVQFISRMHGFDLYAERAPDGWQMFQSFHIAQAERIYIASKAGLDDLEQRWPNYVGKFRLARLGTTDHGAAPWAPVQQLRVVSCSHFVELKRVSLIAESLRHIEGPICWTHFGDGPERSNVEAIVKGLPSNVTVHLMGNCPNTAVMTWYKSNPVDVFVHASYTEGGAPVALQEAASFGIPLLAADAGGVREVVTEASGILLPNALTADVLSKALNDFRGSNWRTVNARAAVRSFWASNFNAEKVYGRFLDEIQCK